MSERTLDESGVNADPLAQLGVWIADAAAAGLLEPTAMTLATVAAGGKPSIRQVLFKGMHQNRLTFYTNHESRKGTELAGNPQVALMFWWDKLERQVRIEGRAEKLPRKVSEQYFHSRPRLSQLAAFTSRQSRVISSRAELDARLAQNTQRFAGQEVPLPESWGGYGVTPEYFEFWQGRRGRLHDRLVYRAGAGGWSLSRLEP